MKEQWVGVYSTRGPTIDVVREMGEVKSLQGFEEFIFYLKSNGGPQTKETVIFVMLKVGLWLLCGERVTEGWGPETGDPLGG